MYHLQYKWWLWCLWVNTGKRKQPNLFSKQKTDPAFWLSWICVHVLPFSFIANFPSIFRPSVAFSCDATGWSSVFMDWRWAKRLWWCLFSAWCLLTPIGIPLKPGTPSLLQKGLATRSSSSWKKSHKYIYIYRCTKSHLPVFGWNLLPSSYLGTPKKTWKNEDVEAWHRFFCWLIFVPSVQKMMPKLKKVYITRSVSRPAIFYSVFFLCCCWLEKDLLTKAKWYTYSCRPIILCIFPRKSKTTRFFPEGLNKKSPQRRPSCIFIFFVPREKNGT